MSTEAMSYGVACPGCGEWETACRCPLLPNACRKPVRLTPEQKKDLARSSARERERKRKKSPLKRTPLKSTRKPIPRENSARRKRLRADNAAYYKSPEWRAKKKAVHERDGYRCVEMIPYVVCGEGPDWPRRVVLRCPNMGMNVNGKQTAKGLVCEKVSYGHRGIPDRIDTCKTRCKDCDRRLTPLERANHANGFRGNSGSEA